MKITAVIFDIDGTIADIAHRLHLIEPTGGTDWEAFNALCIHDKPKNDIIRLLTMYAGQGHSILLVTGRSCNAQKETLQWIKSHSIPYDALYMRPRENFESDWEVKEEILKKHILPNYDIEMVVDDRDSVVEMWRKNGLTCLQCQRGYY